MESKNQGRKKHSFADRLKYMQMLDDGYSINYIHKKYGIAGTLLSTLRDKYKRYGPLVLKKQHNISADSQLRRKIVLDIERNHISLLSASVKYGASESAISSWLRLAREKGMSELDIQKKRGRPRDMGRSRNNSKPLTELERLRKENEELKTEVALLKKVKALVEERYARLRKTGQWSSKD